MTLIVEDVLMILLDDEDGSLAGAGTIHYTLAGAVLAELALRQRVELLGTGLGARVRVLVGPSLDDPLLDAALDRIADKDRGVLDVLLRINAGPGGDLRSRVTQRLIDRGLVRAERARLLGIFPMTTWPASDREHESALRDEVRRVLADGGEPDPRTGAVIAVVHASGELPQVLRLEGADQRRVAERAAEIASGSWGARSVSDAVAMTQAAIVATTATAVGTAVAAAVSAGT